MGALAAGNGREVLAEMLRDFHCHGCGRRLCQYTPDALSPGTMLRFRCRDCKTVSELCGADVAGLLHALSYGKGD